MRNLLLPPLGLSRVWEWPIVLALLSTVGLLAALLGEHGGWLALCWIALGIPLLVIARYWIWPTSRGRR